MNTPLNYARSQCADDLEAVLSLTEPASAAPEPWKCCEGLIECAAPGCAKSRAPEPTCEHGETAKHDIFHCADGRDCIEDCIIGWCPGPAPGSDSALADRLTERAERCGDSPHARSADYDLFMEAAAALRSARPVVAESALAATPAFIEALANPPEPNAKLRAAFARHEREVESRPSRPVVAAVSPTLAEIARAIQYSDVFSPEKTATQSYNDAAVHVRALYAQSAAASPTMEQVAKLLWAQDRPAATRSQSWYQEAESIRDVYRERADEVLALYAQATEKKV